MPVSRFACASLFGSIVAEIFSYARRFVYVNVACYPAEKRLPNGENAHCTVRPPEWWAKLYGDAARYFTIGALQSRQHFDEFMGMAADQYQYSMQVPENEVAQIYRR